MTYNNYKEFVLCDKCHHCPCYCKKYEVMDMCKRSDKNYNTTHDNNLGNNNNCSTVQNTSKSTRPNSSSSNTMHCNNACKKRPRRQKNKYSLKNCNINNCNINNCNSNRRRRFFGLSWLLLFLFFL